MYLSILELDPLSDALHVLYGYRFIEPYMIDFLLHVGGVSELAREVSIVGDEDDPCGITVQSPHGIDAFVTSPLDKVHDRLTALWVVGGSDAVLRLVEQDVYLALG